MEVQERPVFIPPRKRGSKSSPRSNSSHQLSASPISGVSTPISVGTPQHYPKPSLKENNTSSPRLRSLSQEQVFNSQNNRHSSTPPFNNKARKNHTFTPSKHVDIVIEESTNERNRDSGENQCMLDERITVKDFSNERIALNNSRTNRYVTMTGTVKRGKKKGQTMDMQVHMSREELDELEQAIRAHKEPDEEDDRCFFGLCKGPHVFILSLMAFPFVLFISGGYSFYMGTMTWYNMLCYYSERKSIAHKVFVSPVLIVAYPFLIILCTLGLGLFASFIQISWHFESWKLEIVDLEKGFYGWLCCACRLEECSPYEVVILTEIQQNDRPTNPEKKPQSVDTAL